MNPSLPSHLSRLPPPPLRYIFLDKVNSTQDAIIPFIQDSNEKAVFLSARIQHHGRGRKNDDWFSPEGGFWGTLAIPLPNILSTQQFIFLHYAVVSILKRMISEEFHIPVKIKWPNDLVIISENRINKLRKLGGILLEVISTPEKHILLIGMGINFNNSSTNFPENLKNTTVSVSDLIDYHVNIQNFAKKNIPTILAEIWKNVITNFSSKTKNQLKKEYNQNLYNLGTKIEGKEGKGFKLKGINDSGYLLLESKSMEEYLEIGDFEELNS
ncbi:MAG: biotin--[acetyl-CoA-carboxylase] ligase [Promethearchaeota archaeon]